MSTSHSASANQPTIIVARALERQEPSQADTSTFTSAPPDEPLVGSVVWLLVLSLGQKVLGLVRNVLVCRWLDPFQVGLWGIAQAAMDISVPLLLLSIPGSFSRYMEYYRQRGQLHAFLRLTGFLCLLTFVGGFTIALLLHETIARMVFGEARYGPLTILCLVAVVPAALFAFSIELLLGARQGRTVSIGHFVRGILFTVLTISLLLFWRRDVLVMVTAYGVAFLLAALVLLKPILWILRQYPPDIATLPVRSTLRRIAPAIFGCWAMDFLNNLFLTVDRYMLVHWSQTSHDETLAAIGNYEAALVFPLILATVAFMAARMALPHLARDWEQGNRPQVMNAMNNAVTLVAALLILGGCLLQFLAPELFRIALRGQFPAGQQILPYAVTFYIWMALSWVVMNYLWCVERTAWGALTVVIGLAVNCVLNATWVPSLGIVGAAQATVIANALQLTLLLVVTARFGMQWRVSTILMCVVPIALSLGTIPSALGTVAGIGIGGFAMRNFRRTSQE